jgi:hypothetical protein
MKMPVFFAGLLLSAGNIGVAVGEEPQDQLKLRNGAVSSGRFVEGNSNAITFRSDAGVRDYPRAEVAAILFGGTPIATGQVPAWLGAGQGLKVTRWMTYRRITHFKYPDNPQTINNAKISGNGSKIVYSTYDGTYVINPDGTGLTKVGPIRNDGYIDISQDGTKIAWFDNNGIFVASSDGSRKVKMPGGFSVESIRLTAKADRLFVLSRERGIMVLPADGSDLRVICKTEDAAKAVGADVNGNHWRGGDSGIDISDDGSVVVAHFLWNAVVMNGDGSGLKKLTQFRGYDDSNYLYRVRVSGNGQRIICDNNVKLDGVQQTTLTVYDRAGSRLNEYRGPLCDGADWIQVSQDGSKFLASWGVRLFDSEGDSRFDVGLVGGHGDGRNPLYRATHATFTSDMKRIVAVTEAEGAFQLVAVELNPVEQVDGLALNDMSVSPRFLTTDGTTNATVTARVKGEDLSTAEYLWMRAGMELKRGIGFEWLYDDGSNGDETAKDGVASSANARLVQSLKVEPGPFTVRFSAVTKAGSALVVDLEGMEARTP